MKDSKLEIVTDSHEWIRRAGDIAIVGITKTAAKELGEIVYIELPEVGQVVAQGEEVVVLESTKAAVDSYAPLDGRVIEINSELVSHPELVNKDPENSGWLYKLSV